LVREAHTAEIQQETASIHGPSKLSKSGNCLSRNMLRCIGLAAAFTRVDA